MVKRLPKLEVVSYTYDPVRRRTTVTRSRKVTVTVRETVSGGRATFEQRTARGAWVPIPYVWSSPSHALVYDHYLQIRLARTSTQRAAVPFVTLDLDAHLLRRATFGATASSLAELRAVGREAWLDAQLDPAHVDDRACDVMLRAFPHLTEPIWHVNELWQDGDLDNWQHLQDVARTHLLRQCFSRRQLLEVMVEFWSQHFNVSLDKDGVGPSRADYQNVLRAGAFGRFGDLLVRVVTHPSMLVYLDNADSSDEHPNENLGRELLELHTVGVDAGYGEAGVLDSARILTGLSVSSDSGEFLYEPWKHWVGPVRVLGFGDPNPTQTGGLAVVQRYLTYLAHHPATAQRIATRLAVQFVSDTPPASLVARLAAVYLAHDTAIAPVLRALFTSPEFDASVGQKVRRPNEFLVSVVRRLGLRPASSDQDVLRDAMSGLAWRLDGCGMSPLAHPSPEGHSLRSAAWLSTGALLGRWNGAIELASGWTGDAWRRPDVAGAVFGTSSLPATCGGLVDAAALALFGQSLLPADRAALLALMGVAAADRTVDNTWLVGDGLAWWVSALLQSPYQLTA